MTGIMTILVLNPLLNYNLYSHFGMIALHNLSGHFDRDDTKQINPIVQDVLNQRNGLEFNPKDIHENHRHLGKAFHL